MTLPEMLRLKGHLEELNRQLQALHQTYSNASKAQIWQTIDDMKRIARAYRALRNKPVPMKDAETFPYDVRTILTKEKL